jgi:hypothetical protein
MSNEEKRERFKHYFKKKDELNLVQSKIEKAPKKQKFKASGRPYLAPRKILPR